MKVVINSCYGGFNLSDKAIELCMSRGMTLTNFNKEGNLEDPTADFVRTLESFRYWTKYTHTDRNNKKFRSNSILVSVVEELGKEADGPCACLEVIDIPFESTDVWRIEDHDGKERIIWR